MYKMFDNSSYMTFKRKCIYVCQNHYLETCTFSVCLRIRFYVENNFFHWACDLMYSVCYRILFTYIYKFVPAVKLGLNVAKDIAFKLVAAQFEQLLAGPDTFQKYL